MHPQLRHITKDGNKMAKCIDLTGQKFGRLTVINKVKSDNKNSRWLCRCECGKEISVSRVHLINGHTRSCGCYRKEVSAKLAAETKIIHGLSYTKLYGVWANMKDRCYNPNNQAYDLYGGRGIKVCDEWLHGVEEFYIWAINNGYGEGLSIDRIDVYGDYCPQNCRWTTMLEQSRNRRSNRNYFYNGATKDLKQIARESGMNYSTLLKRITKLYMPLEIALAQPLRRDING